MRGLRGTPVPKSADSLGRHLYVIGTAINEAPVKIGISDSANIRLRNVQSGNPRRLAVLHVIDVETAAARFAEAKIHHHFSAKRLVGEWFDVTGQEATEIISAALNAIDRRVAMPEPGTRKAKPTARPAALSPDELTSRIARAGLSIAEVARRAGMHRKAVSAMVNGSRPITAGARLRLLEALGKVVVT